ncbi:MAG: hypothetical protein N2316_02020 [Spirochaetes bacterium]|nr:hypothetical protein [Spirochaetota bacterium]
MKKILFLMLVVLVISVIGCKQQPQQPPANEPAPAVEQVPSEEAPAK